MMKETETLTPKNSKAEAPPKEDGKQACFNEALESNIEGELANEEAADDKFFEELTSHLQSPEFLERLNKVDKSSQADFSPEKATEKETMGDDADEFVWVTKEDVLESMAEVIAQYILSCPEAQHMRPHELQEVIVTGCKDLKKSKRKVTWGWLVFIYRAASLGYVAFELYANPWVLRAIIAALKSAPNLFRMLI